MGKVLKNYPQLLRTIFAGKAILFFGAGASRGARSQDGRNCPLGSELAEDLMQNFLGQAAGSWGLDKVVSYLERNRVDRQKINARLLEIFDPFMPHEPYRRLFDFRCRAFFTTNFDTLIRQAYDLTKGTAIGRQLLVEILRYQTQVDYGDPSKLYLFALHGSLGQHLNPSTPLVLTEQDKIKTRENRIKMLEQLASMQGGGSVVYIGYSFGDEIFWEHLNLLESIEGLSRSYALMPNVSETDKSYLTQHKVEALPLTFEQFMDELCELAEQQGVRIAPAKHTLRLGADKGELELSEEDYHYITEHFDILTEEILTQAGPEPSHFYRGYDSHWSFYERECDVIRLQTREVLAEIHSYMKQSPGRRPSGRANPIVLVSSTAGAGKSVMLRRVAFDCYQRGYAVAWARPEIIHTRGWDVHRLKRFSQRQDNEKFVLVVDNCAGLYAEEGRSMYGLTADLLAALEAETIPTVILLAARSNEFYASQGEQRKALEAEVRRGRGHDAYIRRPLIRADKHFDFDDKLDDNELVELVQKMRRYGAISSDLPDEVYIERLKESDKMLLMALYEVTDRYLRPFAEIVAEEFANLREPEVQPASSVDAATLGARIPTKVWAELRERLGFAPLEPFPEVERSREGQEGSVGQLNLTQRAFLFVSASHQFGLRLPEPCLRRVLQVNWEDFMRRVVHEYALRIIVRDEREDPPMYQTRHPLIARTVFNNLLSPEHQYRVVRHIIDHIEYSSSVERSMMYRLLDADELQRVFDPYQRCDLYLRALKHGGEDTFLLQHLGMLYMKELRDFEMASQYFEAGRLLQPDNPAILNSLGILAGRRGQWHLQQRDVVQAQREFNQANHLFKRQRDLDPSSEYAYQPHAWVVFQQARGTTDEHEQISLLAQVLFIIEEGMVNIPPERHFLLPGLELEIFLYMERTGVLDRIRGMSTAALAADADATYILGRHEGRKGEATAEFLDRLERALVEKPYDRALLKQKAMWLSRFKPKQVEERLKILSVLFHMDAYDIWVTRELSYLSFVVEDIDLHNKCKRILYEVTLHPERSVPQMVRDPNTEELRKFLGTVGEIDESGGRGWILREPRGDKVFFQPFKYPGLRLVSGIRVRFSVGINFMGAVAHDVELA